jgi:hypothetical protein
MSTQDRTVQALGEAVTQELSERYTLVYNDRGDGLPADVVAALVRGADEWETKGGEALHEWAGDVCWVAACDVADELAKELVRRWERDDDADYDQLLDCEWHGSDERASVIDEVIGRDHSEWFSELVNHHGAVLLRVSVAAMDEDADLSFTALTCEHFLDLLGFEHTDSNILLADEVIDNASTEFSVTIGQALIAVDLRTVADLPSDGKVVLRNPHVWLGNPFIGSGWCSETAFTGTLTVDRDDLRTDSDGFGWSWEKVVGGTSPSYFAGEIAPLTRQ